MQYHYDTNLLNGDLLSHNHILGVYKLGKIIINPNLSAKNPAFNVDEYTI